jgi:hypothetical protein
MKARLFGTIALVLLPTLALAAESGGGAAATGGRYRLEPDEQHQLLRAEPVQCGVQRPEVKSVGPSIGKIRSPAAYRPEGGGDCLRGFDGVAGHVRQLVLGASATALLSLGSLGPCALFRPLAAVHSRQRF